MSAFDGRKVRCGGERPMNLEVRGTSRGPRRCPRDGRDRAVGGRDGQERWGGFRGGTMPDCTE